MTCKLFFLDFSRIEGRVVVETKISTEPELWGSTTFRRGVRGPSSTWRVEDATGDTMFSGRYSLAKLRTFGHKVNR